MSEFLKFVLDGIKEGYIAFIVFLAGMVAGTGMVCAAFAVLKRRDKRARDPVAAADVGAAADRAAKICSSAGGKDFPEKLAIFLEAVASLAGDISDGYGNAAKRYAVPFGKNCVYVPLDVTFYELAALADAFLVSAQICLEEMLSDKRFVRLYRAYRVFGKAEKDPRDLRLSSVKKLMTIGVPEPDAEPRANSSPAEKMKAFFDRIVRKVTEPVVNYGVKAVKKRINTLADEFFRELVYAFAEDLNALYSGGKIADSGHIDGLLPQKPDEERAV